MRPLDRIREALERHGCKPRAIGERRIVARCPAHDDHSPSLNVREGENGNVLVHCFTGCNTADVLAALDLSWGDLFVDTR